MRTGTDAAIVEVDEPVRRCRERSLDYLVCRSTQPRSGEVGGGDKGMANFVLSDKVQVAYWERCGVI